MTILWDAYCQLGTAGKRKQESQRGEVACIAWTWQSPTSSTDNVPSECVFLTTSVPMLLFRQLFNKQSKSPTHVMMRASSIQLLHPVFILCPVRKHDQFPSPGRLRKARIIHLPVQIWAPACAKLKAWRPVSTLFCRLFYFMRCLNSDPVTTEVETGRAMRTLECLLLIKPPYTPLLSLSG